MLRELARQVDAAVLGSGAGHRGMSGGLGGGGMRLCPACGGRTERSRGVLAEPVPGWWHCLDEVCGARCRERPGGEREYSRFAWAAVGEGFGFSGSGDGTECPAGLLYVPRGGEEAS